MADPANPNDKRTRRSLLYFGRSFSNESSKMASSCSSPSTGTGDWFLKTSLADASEDADIWIVSYYLSLSTPNSRLLSELSKEEIEPEGIPYRLFSAYEIDCTSTVILLRIYGKAVLSPPLLRRPRTELQRI